MNEPFGWRVNNSAFTTVDKRNFLLLTYLFVSVTNVILCRFYATNADAVADSLKAERLLSVQQRVKMGVNSNRVIFSENTNSLFPVWRQHSLSLVVPSQPVDSALHQNQLELRVLVLKHQYSTFTKMIAIVCLLTRKPFIGRPNARLPIGR